MSPTWTFFGGSYPRRHRPGKLTEAQVREIKQALAAGTGTVELAARYGVTASMVRQIRSGDTWGWVQL